MVGQLRWWCVAIGWVLALHGCGGGSGGAPSDSVAAADTNLSAAGSLIHPQPNSVWIEDDMARPFSWASIAGATKYYLYVGTEPGANDVVDSGELAADRTSLEYSLDRPLDTTLYARLHFFQGGVWYRLPDASFRLGPESAAITAPRMGALIAGTDLTVQWQASAKASQYRVDIGSEPGLSDVASSAQLDASARRYVASAVPTDRPLYVRLSSYIDGAWKWRQDHRVTVSPTAPLVALTQPSAGNSFDPSLPLRWTATPGARHYRLRLGTAPGADDLDDSGPIVVTERYARGLVSGQRVFGVLSAWVNDAWIERSFEFVVAMSVPADTAELDSARRAAALVRAMATSANAVLPDSFLETTMRGRTADCTHYASALSLLLRQANLSLPSRVRNTCLIPNRFDCHTTVEVQVPSGAWQVVDPTFAAIPVDAQSGAALSVAELSDAIRSGRPDRVAYTALDARANDRLQTYYLDYTLLFAQPAALDSTQPAGEISVLHHYERRTEVRSSPGFYALRCAEGSATVTAGVDGAVQDIGCSGVDRLTHVFYAVTIDAASAGAPLPEVHAPRRYTTGLHQQ